MTSAQASVVERCGSPALEFAADPYKVRVLAGGAPLTAFRFRITSDTEANAGIVHASIDCDIYDAPWRFTGVADVIDGSLDGWPTSPCEEPLPATAAGMLTVCVGRELWRSEFSIDGHPLLVGDFAIDFDLRQGTTVRLTLSDWNDKHYQATLRFRTSDQTPHTDG